MTIRASHTIPPLGSTATAFDALPSTTTTAAPLASAVSTSNPSQPAQPALQPKTVANQNVMSSLHNQTLRSVLHELEIARNISMENGFRLRMNAHSLINSAVLEVIELLKRVSSPPHNCSEFYLRFEQYKRLPKRENPFEIAVKQLHENYKRLLRILEEEMRTLLEQIAGNEAQIEIIGKYTKDWKRLKRQDNRGIEEHRRTLQASWERMRQVCDQETNSIRLAPIAEELERTDRLADAMDTDTDG